MFKTDSPLPLFHLSWHSN